MVGLLGGFTTFSAFANETMTAWRSGAVMVAAVNVVLSVVPASRAWPPVAPRWPRS